MLSAIKIALLVYLGFGALLYLAQRSLMYFPVAENPADDDHIEHRTADGERLKVWVLNPGRAHALIYFGGNAEDVYFNAPDFRGHLPDRTAYLVNYRGYGGSSGAPSEQALFADALSLYDDLAGRHAGITLIGRSLGSAVATYLASRRPVERLVLVTPADSALAMARSLYPIYPVGLLLKDRYETVRYAPQVSAPVLILTAEHDRIVPRAHSRRLAAAFPAGRVEQAVIPRAGHNDLSFAQDYWQTIAAFLSN